MLKLASLMLPAPDELRLDALTLDVERKRVTLEVAATQTVLVCPGCSVASGRIKKHFTVLRKAPGGRVPAANGGWSLRPFWPFWWCLAHGLARDGRPGFIPILRSPPLPV